MAYRVEIAPSALREIEEAYISLRAKAPEAADRWYNGWLEAIFSLEEFPERAAVASESAELGWELRCLLYGRRSNVYRVFYAIHDGSTVRVYRVRHGARDRLKPEEFGLPEE